MVKLNCSLTTALGAVVLALMTQPVFAQAEVSESKSRIFPTVQVTSPGVPTAADTKQLGSDLTADLFYQLQSLQQEVSELRGLSEEQANEIKRLKQQRMDDYLDIDRRISALTGAPVRHVLSNLAVPKKVTSAPAPTPTPKPARTSQDDLKSYRTAIDLVLKEKAYDRAIIAFAQYLQDFPEGKYAANSQYWLGEIHLLQNDLEPARERFSRLLTEQPQHPKASDAHYKLGVVYHKLGDIDKAREVLSEIAAGDSNASRLAKIYLTDSLP